ncbi:MAG: RDD family protein [Caldilineaceae bacterium]|nr:RDD family protein [Caldilineaceae bacterium]
MENNNPYTTPSSDISTPEDALEFEYVGFWSRVLASFLDSILWMVLFVPLFFLVYGTNYFQSSAQNISFGPTYYIINYVLPFVIIITFWFYKSATPGKMAINAKIVDVRTGGKPSIGQLIGRYFGYFVSYIPLGLGLLWVGWDKKKQGWHDKLAKTAVIRVKK